ncbi:MAG: DUF1415 domain-containing protein [Pseudomonadota bacterium]|nr:DUF1415 domain-containing protein [Pseudomonadota bacterium]
MTDIDKTHVEADIRRWLERAVIGLNLCPFAKSVYVRNQVRIVISDANNADDLSAELGEEMLRLRDTPPEQIDTTLLVLTDVLQDFLDYNDYLDEADGLLGALQLDGVLQVASFHPNYQFADTDYDAPGNNTNRAPWPVLHLLREDSIDRAVEAYPEPDSIIERNIAAMDKLGNAGYRKLLSGD